MVPETLISKELLWAVRALTRLPVTQSVLPVETEVCEGQATVAAHGLLMILKAMQSIAMPSRTAHKRFKTGLVVWDGTVGALILTPRNTHRRDCPLGRAEGREQQPQA